MQTIFDSLRARLDERSQKLWPAYTRVSESESLHRTFTETIPFVWKGHRYEVVLVATVRENSVGHVSLVCSLVMHSEDGAPTVGTVVIGSPSKRPVTALCYANLVVSGLTRPSLWAVSHGDAVDAILPGEFSATLRQYARRVLDFVGREDLASSLELPNCTVRYTHDNGIGL